MSGTLKLIIRNAKLNSKYYNAKRFNPDKSRLNDDDIKNLRHYCSPEAVYVSKGGLTGDCNTVTFFKAIDGEDVILEFDGTDTGGQFIRLAASYAINYGQGRQLMPFDIVMPNFFGPKGKATMLMVQLVKMTMRVGDIAVFKHGDVMNSDARPITKMGELFDMLRIVFGINFHLEGCNHTETYTLMRKENVKPGDLDIWELDNHMVDEILFTAICLKAQKIDIPRLEINTPISRDYHIDAMIKFGRAVGMDIKDSKPESEEEISRWLGWGCTRNIVIKN